MNQNRFFFNRTAELLISVLHAMMFYEYLSRHMRGYIYSLSFFLVIEQMLNHCNSLITYVCLFDFAIMLFFKKEKKTFHLIIRFNNQNSSVPSRSLYRISTVYVYQTDFCAEGMFFMTIDFNGLEKLPDHLLLLNHILIG